MRVIVTILLALLFIIINIHESASIKQQSDFVFAVFKIKIQSRGSDSMSLFEDHFKRNKLLIEIINNRFKVIFVLSLRF